ncbi:hypothetical protein FV226_22250 [Methylobacterium sp. WL12]|uniref:hypothetical protein n=1 Tax=Methylobacterium sp. WL12 TaxID=2603890 RepID=UPI0011CA27A2|nr:hypothetical protein [Methylobacterium sp. WL12]TXM67277.1 hypothetical protein FV226_22250 [Methylobacterium sp. WL12]
MDAVRTDRQHQERSTRNAAAIWIALDFAYLVFAGTVSVNECVAAIVCATLATAWWWGVGRRGGVRFHFDRAAFRPLGAAIQDLPRQTARAGRHLVEALRADGAGGRICEQSVAELAWVTPRGPAAPAARAVGLLAASLAPDSFVLVLDRAHGTVATHALGDGKP